MIASSALVRYLFSSGGVVLWMLVIAVWAASRPRSRAPRIALLVVAVAYTIAGMEPIPRRIGRLLTNPYHPLVREDVRTNAVAIVLLGSGSYTQVDWFGNAFSVLDPPGAERAQEAARAFKLLGARWIISSGGHVFIDDPDAPAGAVMRDALIQLGVPSDRIIVEQESRTTRDEAVIVKSLLPSLDVNRVVLVTSALHMRRSLGVFRSVGIDAVPAIARGSIHGVSGGMFDLIPSYDGLQASEAVTHELLGLGYYWLRGWQR